MKHLNTIKSFLGFFRTILDQYTPLNLAGKSIEQIYNYIPISDNLSTSGQPTEKQFSLIRDAGFTTVINLAPHDVENALPDEPGTLKQLGLNYVYIPVDFKAPSDEDFDKFVSAMQAADAEKVWLHCAANMRVSAFLYRYRCQQQGEDPQRARQNLEKIWEPFGVWKAFVEQSEQHQS